MIINNKLKIIAGTVLCLHATFYFTKDYFLPPSEVKKSVSDHTSTLKNTLNNKK